MQGRKPKQEHEGESPSDGQPKFVGVVTHRHTARGEQFVAARDPQKAHGHEQARDIADAREE